MNYLITGGCGFIGTALVRRLLKDGIRNIRVVDNLLVGSKDDLSRVTEFTEIPMIDKLSPPNGVELIVADIKDYETALVVCSGSDVIIHLAANTGVYPSVVNPKSDMESNVIGTFNYLESARIAGVNRFVFASSGAPIGEVTPPIHEELAPHPVSPYGASKLAGEGYCSAYYRAFDLETVALRFSNVYGPGSHNKTSVVAKFIQDALGGKHLQIFGDGEQTRDFIYIDDLINAIILAATRKKIGGEIFQIATGTETSVAYLVQEIEKIFLRNGLPKIECVNQDLRNGDVTRSYSDTSKANRVLGWSPNVKLSNGLENTIKYFMGSCTNG